MIKEPEALRLAEWWDQQSHNHALTPESKTAAELRRLHAVNVDLLAALKVTALAIHEYRTQGSPHAYWDDVQEQADAAIAKAEGEQK